jgi:hypothetical protein
MANTSAYKCTADAARHFGVCLQCGEVSMLLLRTLNLFGSVMCRRYAACI